MPLRQKAREGPQMRSAPAAGSSQKCPKKCLKFGPGNSCLFRSKIDPKWTPKGSQNRLKSAKMLPRTPPEWVLRPSPEKVASRTLPQTLSYAENTAPAMLFTLPPGYLQGHFWLHFASLLAPFWAPSAPKSRPKGEKEAFQKSKKKGIEKGAPKSRK